MLKRVHTLTSLSIHKNMTKLTSMDMQVQIFEPIGHRVPKFAVKCQFDISGLRNVILNAKGQSIRPDF